MIETNYEGLILEESSVDEVHLENEIDSNEQMSGIASKITETSESEIFSRIGEDEVNLMKYMPRSEAISTINSVFDRFKQSDQMDNKRFKTVLVTHHNVPILAINKLKEKMKVIMIEENDKQEDILEKAQDVDAIFLVQHNLKLDREMLDFIGERLKVVGLMSAGYENINVKELTRRKIKIGNTREVILDSVAELAICLAIAVAHRFKEGYQSWTLKGQAAKYKSDWLLGQQLAGSVCAIIGYRDLASSIATRLEPFGVKRILYKSHNDNDIAEVEKTESSTLSEILGESDFIFSVCPLTEQTQHMFNYSMLQKMKRTCVFINVGREGVVKTNDLVRALNERLIWGAGLDLTDPEPLPPHHKLLHLDNCFVSPHIGNATLATREAMAMLTADNIIAGMEGLPMPGEVCFKPDPKSTLPEYQLKRPMMRFFAKHFLSIHSHHKYSSFKNN